MTPMHERHRRRTRTAAPAAREPRWSPAFRSACSMAALLCGFAGIGIQAIGRRPRTRAGSFAARAAPAGPAGPADAAGSADAAGAQDPGAVRRRQEQAARSRPNARRRAHGWPRQPMSGPGGRRSAADAGSAAAAASPRRRRAGASRRPTSSRSPARPLYDPSALRTIFLQFEEQRLGTGAGGLQQHRRRRAGHGDRRRQDVQGRRRALPRDVVVLHGAGRARSAR